MASGDGGAGAAGKGYSSRRTLTCPDHPLARVDGDTSAGRSHEVDHFEKVMSGSAAFGNLKSFSSLSRKAAALSRDFSLWRNQGNGARWLGPGG